MKYFLYWPYPKVRTSSTLRVSRDGGEKEGRES